MKITKQCPECGGREIYTVDSYLGPNTVSLVPGVNGLFGSFPQVEVYICGTCGFHQMFVKPETLEKVKEKYSRYK